MTSEERRAARRIRREEKRRKKKEAVNEKYGKLENVFDYGNLLEAFDKSKKGVRWKCSVQRYEASLLRKTYDTHMKLLKGEDIRRGFHRFTLMERGKLREISSVHISERVVQRSLCDNALVPVLTRTCISDKRHIEACKERENCKSRNSCGECKNYMIPKGQEPCKSCKNIRG